MAATAEFPRRAWTELAPVAYNDCIVTGWWGFHALPLDDIVRNGETMDRRRFLSSTVLGGVALVGLAGATRLI